MGSSLYRIMSFKDFYNRYQDNTVSRNESGSYGRAGGMSRSMSQWDMTQEPGGRAQFESSPRSQHSSSSWDLARPPTRGSSNFTSPPPYHDLATGEYRYLHRMRWKKEREDWNLANGINFSYTSPFMTDNCSIVKS